MPKKAGSLIQRQIKIPKEFKKFFLLRFTEELIRHYGESELLHLENILEEKTQEKKEEVKKQKKKIQEIIKNKEEPLSTLKEKFSLEKKTFKPLPKSPITRPRVLRIPEPKLPPRFQYLKPTPTKVQIDLGKLNDLIKDPSIRSIECNGPDENILVRGTMGTKRTNIILNKKEIGQIIQKFSETAKIPIQEGIFRVVVGKLILSAIISEVVGSKFIIKKMIYYPITGMQKKPVMPPFPRRR